MSITHAELVDRARIWLARRCPVVATEVATAAEEIPDVIGWRGSTTLLVECKASRSDFAADRQKFFRGEPKYGMGYRRYYLTPPALVEFSELPAGWGLLELHGRGVRVIHESSKFRERNVRDEALILVSLLRRIGGQAPLGVSIKCYTIQTKCTASLTVNTDCEQ